MISVLFLKMCKHSDFLISSFQVVDAWHILQWNRKTEKYFKEFIQLEKWLGSAITFRGVETLK